jgi:copper chaperone CopZ
MNPITMKKILLIPVVLAALSLNVHAETTGSISGVHNCCRSCENAIMKVAATVSGITVTPKGGTLNIVAKGKADIKKFQDKLLDAGFWGEIDAASGSEAEKPKTASVSSSSSSKKVKTATVSGAHICCQKCRDMVMDTVKGVPGVKSSDVMPDVKNFKVEGEFSKEELEAALRKAGFGGKVK